MEFLSRILTGFWVTLTAVLLFVMALPVTLICSPILLLLAWIQGSGPSRKPAPPLPQTHSH